MLPADTPIHEGQGQIKPTGWDVRRTWQSVKAQLPPVFRDATSDEQWMMSLDACRTPAKAPPGRVNTAAMYKLRKTLNGLVCGPLDKNNGELWLACPCLYKRAVAKVLPTTGGGYAVIHPKKVTAYQKKKHQGAAILDVVTGTDIPKKRQRGGESDVIEAWRTYYKRQGWDKIARFDHKGRARHSSV